MPEVSANITTLFRIVLQSRITAVTSFSPLFYSRQQVYQYLTRQAAYFEYYFEPTLILKIKPKTNADLQRIELAARAFE